MKILSLDCSSSVSSVACVILRDHAAERLFQQDTPHGRADSSALFRGLEAAMVSCGSPDALCVGLGPGSYNGLRAGIAAARALATALEIPLHALPSPLSLEGPKEGFWVAGDARGGHYWLALVEAESFAEPPCLIRPEAVASRLASRPGLPLLGSTPLAGLEGLRIATPDAARLAMLAQRHDPMYLSPLTPEPLYLKPPHITHPKAANAP